MWHFNREWNHYCLLGETPREEIRAVLDRLENQHFNYNWSSVFVLVTAGIFEDGWTLYVNGVVDFGTQMHGEASASLGVPWPPDAMKTLTERYVETDLISMGLMQRS